MKRDLRGMRDIPSMQRLRRDNREQLVTELAQLEHERARLERELDVWLRNQANTTDRLRQVEQRLALIQEALSLSEKRNALQPSVPPKAALLSPLDMGDDGDEVPNWQEMPLEY